MKSLTTSTTKASTDITLLGGRDTGHTRWDLIHSWPAGVTYKTVFLPVTSPQGGFKFTPALAHLVLIYSLKPYFVSHINAKGILYLNLGSDEVIKAQTKQWLLNYRSGHCLETRNANLCRFLSLTYVNVTWACCTGWLVVNITVFWEINTVMQIKNMLNKYGWQSQSANRNVGWYLNTNAAVCAP